MPKYTKTTWMDRLVQFANRYTKSNETASSVTLTADPGTVTQAGTPISATNLNKLEDAAANANNENAGTALTFGYGPQIFNAVQTSPLNIKEIRGRTLVNLLGRDGNCEDTSKWSSAGGTISLNSSMKLYGANSIRFQTSGQSHIRKNGIPVKNGAKHVAVINFYSSVSSAGQTSLRLNDDGTDWNLNLGNVTIPSTTGVWHTVFVRFTATSNPLTMSIYNNSGAADFYIDGARVYEITQAEYDALATMTADQVAAKYPYTEGITPTRGIHVTKWGKNLLPPFNEGWSLHTNAVATSPYSLTLAASAAWQLSQIEIPVTPNTSYVFSNGGGNGGYFMQWKNTAGSYPSINGGIPVPSGYILTAPSDAVALRVQAGSAATGTFTFTNPQLEIGSTATTFEPRQDNALYIDTDLHSSVDGTVYDTLYQSGTEFYKVARFKELTLDGSLTWSFVADGTGYKRVKTTPLNDAKVSTGNGGVSNVLVRLTKYNGNPLFQETLAGQSTDREYFYVVETTKEVTLGLADIDTGWGESYTPTAADIQNYFASKPYKLVYQLATTAAPERVTSEGAITLHEGGNYVETGVGVIVRERANPILASGYYFINDSFVAGTNLKNRTEKIISVSKNGQPDKKWLINTSSQTYGKFRAQIPQTDFDPTAVYEVTYVAQQPISAAFTTISGEYWENVGSVAPRNARNMAALTQSLGGVWKLLNPKNLLELIKRVDGAGSGLDAELLAGQYNYEFMTMRSPLATNQDWNNITTPGMYQVGDTATHVNHPGIGNWMVLEVYVATVYVVQRATSLINGLTRVRTRSESTWSAWRTDWGSETIRFDNGFAEWNDNGTWKGVGGVKNIQRGSVTLSTTEGASTITQPVTISAVSSMSKALVFISYSGQSGGADSPNVQATLTSTTNIDLKAMNTAAASWSVSVSWQVIEYH